MRRKHKLLFAVMAVLMILLLASCGGGDEEQGTGGEETEQTGENNFASGEDVSISDLFSQAKAVKGMSYDMIYTEHLSGHTMEGSIWIQGSNQKIKVKDPTGEEVIYIHKGEEGTAYTYMPAQKMALKIDVGEMPETEDPVEYVNRTDTADTEYLGIETYDGVKCYMYGVGGFGDDGSNVTMWIHEDYGIPVKIEVVNGGQKMLTTEYKNLQVGELPEDTFDLPEGVNFQDMGAMLNDLQNPAEN